MRYSPALHVALLGICLTIAGTAFAQMGPTRLVEIGIGDARLRADLIHPYTVRWNATAVTPDNRIVEQGYRTEEVRRGDCARPCWRRLMRIFDRSGQETATQINLFDARTLAPILTDERRTGGDRLLLRVDGRNVEGRQDAGAFFHIPAHHRDVHGRLARPSFEFNDGPAGLYLALMPHEAGTTLRFPLIDIDNDANPLSVANVDYRLFNRTTLTIGGHAYDAIVIDGFTTYGYWQYWVTEEPPFLLRWLFVGPGGGRTVYNLAPLPPAGGA